MSRLRRALRSRKSIDQALEDGTYGVPGFGSWGSGMVWNPGGGASASSMRISAVYACIRLLTDAIATLPADTYTRRGPERIEYPKPSYLRFDAGLTRAQYLTQVMMSLLIDGNAFTYVVRSGRGIEELLPLDPTKVEVRRGKRGPEYVISGEVFSTLDIVHIPALVQPGGLRGLSPIGVAREVIDIAGEAQNHGRSWFANAAVPPAVIKVPPSEGHSPNQSEVDNERARRVAKAWNDTHGGTSNAGKVGVLIGGAELQTVAVPNKDSQWLESRQFSVQEIARIFGVPPHLIGDASGSTSWGSGLASQNLTFGQFALRPWIERIENGHDRLLSSDGLPEVFWKLNLDALLRSSLDDRYSSYAMGIRSGFLTPNEARAWEELPPVEGGDEVLRIPVGASPQQGPEQDDPQEGDDDQDQ